MLSSRVSSDVVTTTPFNYLVISTISSPWINNKFCFSTSCDSSLQTSWSQCRMTRKNRKYRKAPKRAVARDAPSNKLCCSRNILPNPAKSSSIHSFPSNEKSDQKDEKKISQYPLQCPSGSKKKKCSSASFEDDLSFISFEDDEDDLSFISLEDDEDDVSLISFEDDVSFISFEDDDDKHDKHRDYVNLNRCNVDGNEGASTCSEKSVSNDETSHRKKRVQFADSPQLVTVHLIVAWGYAYRRARMSPWMRMACDSQRFRRKIRSLEPILSPVLNPEHRAKIWETRMLNEE